MLAAVSHGDFGAADFFEIALGGTTQRMTGFSKVVEFKKGVPDRTVCWDCNEDDLKGPFRESDLRRIRPKEKLRRRFLGSCFSEDFWPPRVHSRSCWNKEKGVIVVGSEGLWGNWFGGNLF